MIGRPNGRLIGRLIDPLIGDSIGRLIGPLIGDSIGDRGLEFYSSPFAQDPLAPIRGGREGAFGASNTQILDAYVNTRPPGPHQGGCTRRFATRCINRAGRIDRPFDRLFGRPFGRPFDVSAMWPHGPDTQVALWA